MRDVDKKLEYWQTHREVTTNFIVERASALEIIMVQWLYLEQEDAMI